MLMMAEVELMEGDMTWRTEEAAPVLAVSPHTLYCNILHKIMNILNLNL
jgi:hypothetical protein